MELLRNLFEGYPNLWGGGVAHSVLILSLVIAFGIILAKIKIAGISLGVTWILFVGIVFGHFNLSLDEHLLHFLKEFGLILFVYSIGLQVGPGFFSAFIALTDEELQYLKQRVDFIDRNGMFSEFTMPTYVKILDEPLKEEQPGE